MTAATGCPTYRTSSSGRIGCGSSATSAPAGTSTGYGRTRPRSSRAVITASSPGAVSGTRIEVIVPRARCERTNTA